MMQRLFGKKETRSISTTSEKESSATPILTAEQTILMNLKASEITFKQELPVATEAIKTQLHILEKEFTTLQASIASAQQKDNFNANEFHLEIFTLKEVKCDRDLNDLYLKAQAAYEEVARYSKWGLSKENIQEWSAKKKEMEKDLQNQCKKPIKEFSAKIADYAQRLGLRQGDSASLVSDDNSTPELLVPDPLISSPKITV